MRTIIQIGGAIIFLTSVWVTVLFAEGYQYDPEQSGIVQKGVVYFEGVSAGALWIDSEEVSDTSFPGEVRLLPGVHELELRAEGFYPWKKKIALSLERVVIFPPIFLTPYEGSALITTPLGEANSWKLSSYDESSITLINNQLHIEKKYLLENESAMSVRDNTEVDFSQGISFPIVTAPASFSIDNTFHVLTLDRDKTLALCDRDRENCHPMGKLDEAGIIVNEAGRSFVVKKDSQFTLLRVREETIVERVRSLLF